MRACTADTPVKTGSSGRRWQEPKNAFQKSCDLEKNSYFVPLLFHSVETLRRTADFKWEQMCVSVLRLKGWKPHPFGMNRLRWVNFFLKGGSVGQNFNFFTKMAGEFLFMNSESCLSPVLCAHVSRLKGCKPFPYQSRPTDAIALWPKEGSAKKKFEFSVKYSNIDQTA